MPTTTSFEPITLERGVTHDPEFETWANLIYAPGAGGTISLKNFRKDITIELLNENGIIAKAYNVYRCSTMARSRSQPSFSILIISIATALALASRSGRAWYSDTQQR